MFQLSKLGSLVKKRKRIGRGGSRGGSSGKGTKGQKARTGGKSKVRTAFEGGQMPLVRRLPKRGFNNKNFETKYQAINLGALESVFDAGQEVTKEMLRAKKLLKGNGSVLVKILAGGTLSKKLVIHADAVSEAAAQMIEKCGGRVELIKEM